MAPGDRKEGRVAAYLREDGCVLLAIILVPLFAAPLGLLTIGSVVFVIPALVVIAGVVRFLREKRTK